MKLHQKSGPFPRASRKLGIRRGSRKPMHGTDAARILETIDERVRTHIGDVPAGDDVTMLALTRL